MLGSRRYVFPRSFTRDILYSRVSYRIIQNGGFETPADGPGSGALTNFVEIGQARDKLLSIKLDQLSSSTASTSGLSTSIDPKGYLTSLSSIQIKSDAEIGDIKRARMLFDSLVRLSFLIFLLPVFYFGLSTRRTTRTDARTYSRRQVKSNPKHAPGWIAAACLEEHAGRMVAARKIIKMGCEQCPKSEDVWLEAARLHVSVLNLCHSFVFAFRVFVYLRLFVISGAAERRSSLFGRSYGFRSPFVSSHPIYRIPLTVNYLVLINVDSSS